jgi:Xaa-Pro aminopeptidase
MRELRFDALIVVGVAQISERRGKGWLAYLFGYLLEQRHAYGLIGIDGATALVLPPSLRWTLRDADPSLYRLGSPKRPLGAELAPILGGWGVGPGARVGIVGLDEMMPVSDYLELQRSLPGTELVESGAALGAVRAVKTVDELEAIREANRIAELGFAAVAENAAPGVSIRELGARVAGAILGEGAVDSHLLVSFGPGGRSSPFFSPPAVVDHRLERDDVLVFSIELTGPHGYWIELARMLTLGALDAELEQMVEVACAAIACFEQVAVPGATGGDIYRQVDAVVSAAGLRQGHSAGHGIGQDVVEWPRIAPDEAGALAEGMVIAFHPHLVDTEETMSSYLANVYRIDAHGSTPFSEVALGPVRAHVAA